MPLPMHNIMFIPSILPPLSPPIFMSLAKLMLSDDVQKISFNFGSVRANAEGWRKVAAALLSGKVKVSTKATDVPPGSTAFYYMKENPLTDANTLALGSDKILDFDWGRGVAIHECKHAMADILGRASSLRSEESAARIAEAWYLRNVSAPQPPDMPEPIWQIAQDLANRAALEGRPVRVTGSEITTCRKEVAKLGYANEHRRWDGV